MIKIVVMAQDYPEKPGVDRLKHFIKEIIDRSLLNAIWQHCRYEMDYEWKCLIKVICKRIVQVFRLST